MAASKFFFFSLLFALTFTASRGEPPLRHDGVSSHSDVGVELELLKSRIASLESSIDERNRELRERDESAKELQKMIQEKSDVVASLGREIELLQGSLDGKEDMSKSDREAGELEKQVERLRKDIELQNKKKDGLGARASLAEKKIQKLNLKLKQLHKVNYEQENRIHKTEHLLQVAEEELMKVEEETAFISTGLNKVHREWLPDWLSVHVDHIQLYVASSWNESWGLAVNVSLQKALEKKAQVREWIKLQIELIKVDWIPILKEQWLAFVTFIKPLIQSLTAKIADLYQTSKSSIATYAFNMLKDLCSHAKVWIPILKEQLSAFITSIQPRVQLLTETIVDMYHTSKSFIAPHAFKLLKVLYSYTHEARKVTESYMHQIAIITRSCLEKTYFSLKSITVKIFHICGKFLTASSLYHHQVQEMLKNIAFVRAVANMDVAWFVATALLALPALFLFKFYSAVFRKKLKKTIQSSDTNLMLRRCKQVYPDR